MNIPEEFGKYLLLKKLTEDPLGETFRAGKVGKEGGMEQVVLLRVFNGKGVDGEKLWQKASGRANIQQSLKSPNIGSGVDLGRVRSFPYAAYDYISGKNLGALLAQANKQMSPIPTDHALLVAERIALALAAAYETRIQDERILHGFVVPQLIMISNEGETRLLGFEAAPGLRSLASAGWQDSDLRPYLSPETFEGAAASRADDVFSLGAILFEMLTGERITVAAPDAYAARIDSALLANEGTPLPAEIAALLKKSLTGRDQRIADAVTWHKTLSKLMIDGHFSPTTFNLAFFMHNLFRDEIERESQEIQAEKKLELPKKAAEPVAAPVPVSHETREVATSVRDVTLSGTRSQFVEEKSKKGLWIGIAAALLVAAGVGGYFMMSGGSKTAAVEPAPAFVPAAQPAAMPGGLGGVQPAAVPAGPTPEELQAQIQSMISAQGKQVEDKLKDQYDDRIKLLQQQLEESRKAAVEQDRQAARQPERSASVPVQETPEPEVKTAAKAETPAPAPVIPEPTPEPQKAEPVQQAPAPVPAPAPVRKTQFGDLVQFGASGATPPKLASRLEPRYPAAAQRLNKAADVDIKVLVDENGRVTDSQRVGQKAGFGFDEAAIEAARRAQFNPATKDGVRVKMWYTLRVKFAPGR
ncbi:MAG: eukaryotic-like serine/threonine-protein kinase [Acidobacteriota bacterium]|jgi:TonB family protein|nr:eukaryotic-like serine/threonine-protein kinase [Acidobacteriota bacterium]